MLSCETDRNLYQVSRTLTLFPVKSEPTIIHLYPHRSLSRRGFALLMGCIAAVSFAAGIGFLLIGAWPVFGFFGLDVVLIWWALKRNFRDGKAKETITINNHDVSLTRHRPGKQDVELDFVRSWTRVELETDEKRDLIGRLFLVSRGAKIEIGSFLSPDDRKSLCSTLNGFLSPARI
jgi:uncharacterized membrane protein